MSWALSAVGSKGGVKKKVEAETHMPTAVKSAIVGIVELLPDSMDVIVETNGHIDPGGHYSGNTTLKIVSVERVF